MGFTAFDCYCYKVPVPVAEGSKVPLAQWRRKGLWPTTYSAGETLKQQR